MKGKVTIITGGQYGSEAKGAIVDAFVRDNPDVCAVVRTGCTNAGHTVYHDGKPYAMQQLPVSWAARPDTPMVIGAGAVVDMAILERELALVESILGYRPKVMVDYRAYIHSPNAAQRSAESGRHHRIGATGKGCSEAVVDRIRLRGDRDASVGKNAGAYPFMHNVTVNDTEAFLNSRLYGGGHVVLEGCQGTLLDLVLGPYPYVTHKQTTPAQWLSECGISPTNHIEVGMVIRTMPIRVAGNSGPLSGEVSWVDLARAINHVRQTHDLSPIVKEESLVRFSEAVVAAGREMGLPASVNPMKMHKWAQAQREQYPAAVSEIHKMALQSLNAGTVADLKNLFEMTTVTKKLRRIATMDYYDLGVAVRQLNPTWVAITFMNYLFPEYWGSTSESPFEPEIEHVNRIQVSAEAPVKYFNRSATAMVRL